MSRTSSEKKLMQPFQRYQILNLLGQGGMGRVYKAWDPELKRIIALKMIDTEKLNERKRQRFVREIQAVAQLNHKNIVELYEVGCEDGIDFYTMTYIEGDSLANLLVKGIELDRGLAILCEVARAVHYAHSRGIIHRDLKPANIVVSNDGVPYVVDFGLAKMRQESFSLTKNGAVIGTLAYMPPEQVQGKKELVDARNDVYSLGVILYEIMTGRLPFCSQSLSQLYRLIIDEIPIPPQAINPNIPNDLQAVCLKAMAKRRKHRYSSAEELASDLDRFMKGQKVIAASKRPVIIQTKKIYRGILWAVLLFFVTAGVRNAILQNNNGDVALENAHQSLVPQERIREIQRDLASINAPPDEKQTSALREELIFLFVEISEPQAALVQYSYLPKSHKLSLKTSTALVKAYYSLRQFDEADRQMGHILSNHGHTNISTVLFYRGMISFHREQYQQAAADFVAVEKNLQLPFSLRSELLFYLGMSYFHMGCQRANRDDFWQAYSYLQKAQKFLPEVAKVHEYLGKAALENQGQQSAYKELEQLDSRQVEKAWRHFRKCVELQPNNAQYRDLLGRMCYARGEIEEAVRELTIATKLDPFNIDTIVLLTAAYNKQVVWESSRPTLMMSYFIQYRRIPPPDLLADFFRDMAHQYREDYLRKLAATSAMGNPRKFLDTLDQSHYGQQSHENAKQGLFMLRYHPQLDSYFDESNNREISREKKKFLRALQKSIADAKTRESKRSFYYQLIQLYLYRD